MTNMSSLAFNPDHPDADWSGYVAPRTSRKHPEGTPSAMAVHIATNETGFGPDESAKTAEWAKPARKITKPLPSSSSTFPLIGGPVPIDDPSAFDPSRWETEAVAAANRLERTDINRLTGTGRAMHIRGKKQAVPEFEKESSFDPERARRLREENPYNLNEGGLDAAQVEFQVNDGKDLSKLAGYRASSQSLISGLASEVAKGVKKSKCVTVSSSPFATDGNLPTDPYLSANGERKKDMLLENYSSIVPGYTGKRTFI